MQRAQDKEPSRPSARARRLIVGGVAALLGLGPGAGAVSAQRDAPPSKTPAAGERSQPPIDEIQRRAKPLPIPTRDAGRPAPGAGSGPEGPEQRVPGSSGDERRDDGIAPASVVALAAAGGLLALVAWRCGRPLVAALRRRRDVGRRRASSM